LHHEGRGAGCADLEVIIAGRDVRLRLEGETGGTNAVTAETRIAQCCGSAHGRQMLRL
jgi:hypothetical protein